MTGGVDLHNNPMTGTTDAIALYDSAIDRLIRFHPDVVDLATQLTAEEPVPMASALSAYLNLMSTDADDLASARASWHDLDEASTNERERAHANAIGAWLDGDWQGASTQLDELLSRWPTDVLALMLGHQLDFFLGDAANLRDRPMRALREFNDDDMHIDFVRGMASFGLEEAGHYGQALDVGLAAVGTNPDDVWGIHAVVHTYEMQGRVDEGIGFLTGDSTRWESGNLFTVHNWWHLALYYLEAGLPQRALEIYDAEIHHAGSAGVPIEMLDATALLWRLLLDDVDTGTRFATVADAWAAKTDVPWYAFNDFHAAMAFAGAARVDDARRLIKARESWLATATGSNTAMTREVGLPASRAVLAFAEQRYDDVVNDLMPIRRVFQHFGGSHAQRDALQRTLLESAIRSGRYELARFLSSERLGVRDAGVYNWTQRARALRGLGDATGAEDADRHAATYRRKFATAATGSPD
ncbi:MAG TPA: tetratricopeptide repeat protein [Ilumatobacteraceae bacterium]|nr:tetratricopeptide repeat protein [Ilumatobacteraceae bacterium]